MRGLILTVEELLAREEGALIGELKRQFPEAEAAQIRSWQVLIRELKEATALRDFPGDCVIAVEYALPTDGMAIDLVVAGLNGQGRPVACIVESKQWGDAYIAKAQLSAYRETGKELHPQVQISHHRLSFSDYLDIGPRFDVVPFVYTPNASQRAVEELVSRNPKQSSREIPVFNRMDALLSQILQRLSRGEAALVQTLRSANFVPSKGVMEAMGAIATQEEPYLLNQEQQDAMDRVKAAIAEGKKVVRITGAGGAGKTGILLNLYVQYLSEQKTTGVIPIFVSGAQNTACYRGAYPDLASSFTYSFSLDKMINSSNSSRCVVLMDEAQHNQPGIITKVLNMGATLVLCYDVTQVIRADNAVRELRGLEQRPDFVAIELHGSVRYNGSQVAEKNIRTYLRGGTQFQEDPQYEFKVFSDFTAFQDQLFDTIARHPDRTLAVSGLLCADARKYTKEGNPASRLFTNWGSKTECKWVPYVRGRDYLNQYGGDLWVGTWWMPGLDFDYVAVIAGGDAAITEKGVVGNPRQSKHYQMMVSVAQVMQLPKQLIVEGRSAYGKPYTNYVKSCQNIVSYLEQPGNEMVRQKFIHDFSQYLRNNYYIMMTRGRRGCFVYFANHYHQWD